MLDAMLFVTRTIERQRKTAQDGFASKDDNPEEIGPARLTFGPYYQDAMPDFRCDSRRAYPKPSPVSGRCSQVSPEKTGADALALIGHALGGMCTLLVLPVARGTRAARGRGWIGLASPMCLSTGLNIQVSAQISSSMKAGLTCSKRMTNDGLDGRKGLTLSGGH